MFGFLPVTELELNSIWLGPSSTLLRFPERKQERFGPILLLDATGGVSVATAAG